MTPFVMGVARHEIAKSFVSPSFSQPVGILPCGTFDRFGATHSTIAAGRNICICPAKKRIMILAEILRYNMTPARKKSLELLNSRERHF
jgi:hypothetical protein